MIIDILKDKEKINHYIRYVIFGILTTFVSFGSFYILRKIFKNINENILNSISIVFAIIFAYTTNRRYVFNSKKINIFIEFCKFVYSRAFSAIFEVVGFYILTSLLLFEGMLSKVIISLFVIVLNYITSKVFVFNSENKHEN